MPRDRRILLISARPIVINHYFRERELCHKYPVTRGTKEEKQAFYTTSGWHMATAEQP